VAAVVVAAVTAVVGVDAAVTAVETVAHAAASSRRRPLRPSSRLRRPRLTPSPARVDRRAEHAHPA
jgi:hypothetical protein